VVEGARLAREKIVDALESVIAAGDRIVMEGDNQKQADFLSRSLVEVDAEKVHDLHLIISSISRPEHLTLFELGIANKVDLAFAGSRTFE
jgi:malonate decarboxylase alpha subunit